jgi:hypothetical protein
VSLTTAIGLGAAAVRVVELDVVVRALAECAF